MHRLTFAILALLCSALVLGASDGGLGPVPTNAALTAPGPIGSVTPNTGAFTTISATGAITSTLATGTAPLTVASTTVVGNLNSSLLNGTTWTAPGAIGGGTPAAGAFTTLSATGAITSTLATGTAPFTVASTTVVGNLNVSQLLGSTWASPAAIGTGTPSTGAFSSLTSSGDIATTGYLKSTVSADTSSINITGSGTTSGTNAIITMYGKSHASQANRVFYQGARHYFRDAAGGTDYFNADGTNVVLALPTLVTSTTDATSAATGAEIISGGLGVTKNIVGKQGLGIGCTSTATAAGTTAMSSSSTMVQVFTGVTTQALTLPAANVFGAGVGYVVAVKNLSTGLVTVQRAGSDTINSTASNVTSFTLAQWASCTLYSDGVSAWQRF